jgi:Ca2+-transporting ATPase
LCSDAHRIALGADREAQEDRKTVGDPTEVALVEAAAAAGFEKAALEAALPRLAEAPFDSDRRRMTTVHRLPDTLPPALEALAPQLSAVSGGVVGFTKGGVEAVLGRCTAVWSDDGDPHPLDEAMKARIAAAHDRLADEGMRVLAVAFRPLPPSVEWEGEAEGAADPEAVEEDLTFLGLLGLLDPPRAEVPQAVATCLEAGIRPILITGDHPLTARAIARQVGILSDLDEGAVVVGTTLARLSDEELEAVVDRAPLYARVAPEHKLRLVEALQRRGEVVAMTGDGVNDAPALKRADIGVAMGRVGTDVAKEAADMVLRDDNFATLVTAVEEGRRIYDNIRKFVRFLLTSNSGEIWVMLLGPLLGLPLPLLPLQILWMNLVTDGLPALALGVEPTEKDVMRRPPRPPAEGILGRGLAVQVLVMGLLLGVVTLSVGVVYWNAEVDTWRTVLFTTLVFAQLSLALAVRSERASFFALGAFSNPALLGAVLLSTLLHLAVVYLPPFQGFFATVPLSWNELGVALAVGSFPFWALEGWKWGTRRLGGACLGGSIQ